MAAPPATLPRAAGPSRPEACPYNCSQYDRDYNPSWPLLDGSDIVFTDAGQARACLAKCGGGFIPQEGGGDGDTTVCPTVKNNDGGLVPCRTGEDARKPDACGLKEVNPRDAGQVTNLYLPC
jgi:hypothetical protein